MGDGIREHEGLRDLHSVALAGVRVALASRGKESSQVIMVQSIAWHSMVQRTGLSCGAE